MGAGSEVGVHPVSVLVNGLQPSTTYHYRLVATSNAGTSDGGDVSFTTPPALTLSARGSLVVYGRAVTLSGTVSGAPAGVKVSVLAEALGQSSFAPVGSVLTGTAGAWSYEARPSIATSYEVSAAAGTSPPVTIGVRPAILVHLASGARVTVRVVAPTSFAGRVVQLQRLGAHGWKTVARSRLATGSTTTFHTRVLPTGRSTIRVAMSVNQAGRGYLAGFSGALVSTHR